MAARGSMYVGLEIEATRLSIKLWPQKMYILQDNKKANYM